MNRLLIALAFACTLGLAQAALATDKDSAGTASTVENLQAAFNGDSNAHARYLAFAKKADEEGYARVARLFRAVARSEEIHARNHAEVIKALGATPKAEVKAPDVKTTAENLTAAIAREINDRDTMYPEFVTTARAARRTDAVRTLNLARQSEVDHARLFQLALGNLEFWRVAKTPFYVCGVCGYTSETLPNKCPVSFTPKEKFETIE